MAGQIQVYTGNALSSVESWVGMDEAERRRRATEAANARDPEKLWELTRAHLILHGGKGAHLSRHTERSYAAGIRFLCADWQDVNFLHPDRDRAALWLRTLETRGLSTSTITVRLAAARALYRALRWARVTDADPLSDIRPASDPTPAHEKRQAYRQNDVDKLLELASPIDRVLILLGAHGGLRISEILALVWADRDIDAGTLTVRSGKGGKKRTIDCSARLLEALSALSRESESITIIPYRTDTWARARLKRLCVQAGVPYRAVHSLRHYCGTRWYRETGKLELAQRALGHSNISTTQVYVHMANDELKNRVADW
jgi:integrase